MNPNSHNGGETAPATFEHSAEHYADGEISSGGNEKIGEAQPAAAESQTKLATPPLNIPTAAAPVIPTDDAKTQDNAQSLHLTGSDVDRIEKQDLEAAKSIIEHTKDDPYVRKNEMSKFKAEYIQKRFNKAVKVDT